ncbi:hypothetical protein DNTS_014377 [Danionella cerebrum]|uniref:Uncharacterized protein n=1 Tax=Danionella cerebrum TaxID=2873325 RepID=A0A553RQT2_9TELE|nr:hypothetical protein DNTS_014377 [Danionella translucida]
MLDQASLGTFAFGSGVQTLVHQSSSAWKRSRGEDEFSDTEFPHFKRGKLLFERVPGRNDGQTRLRFF